MADLAGLVLLLGAMLLILRAMIVGRFGHPRSSKRRYERPPRRWWRAAAWVPTGFAVTKLIGTGAPLSVVVALAILLAAAHRAVPGPIDLVAGGLGTAISVLHVVEGNDCRGPLGVVAVMLLLVFCGITAVLMLSSAVALGRLRPSQYFIATCAAIELALFASSPGSIVVTDSNQVGTAVAATLVLAVIVGLLPNLGLAAMGACLIVAETHLAFVGQLCDRSAPVALAGGLAFAGTRLLLSSRSRRQLVGIR